MVRSTESTPPYQVPRDASVSVVRIGPIADDNKSTELLRSRILDYFAKTAAPGGITQQNSLIITNRYFSARVLLKEVSSVDSESTAVPTVEEGVILVFDCMLSDPKSPLSFAASFDSMNTVHDQIASSYGDLLRLCVGVGDSKNRTWSEKEYEAEYSRRVLWCLDRGYEYVEADLSDNAVLEGHDDRDKDGFARIVEAIAGTVWSSAVMKDRKNHDTLKAVSCCSTPTDTNDSQDTYEPPKSLSPSNSKEAESELEEGKYRKDLLGNGGSLKKNEANVETFHEQAFHAMEGTLREANRIRELAKSGQLSDQERRKRAGDAAVLLMNMMKNMGFDEDADDDSSVDETQ